MSWRATTAADKADRPVEVRFQTDKINRQESVCRAPVKEVQQYPMPHEYDFLAYGRPAGAVHEVLAGSGDVHKR